MLECTNDSIKEVNDILVLLIIGIAGEIEGRCAGSVLGELMSPEVGVGGTLVNPILAH